jgi:pilus assembly protein CpaB
MGRRTVLLLVATLIAAVGTALVFLYVRGLEARASESFEMVRVIEAVETIPAGETLAQAQAAGKLEMARVPRAAVLPGAVDAIGDLGPSVALTTLHPGEQIIAGKFGDPGNQETLNIPEGKMAISVDLSDPARVAGFVTPGAEVAVFISAEPELVDPEGGQSTKLPKFTRLLLPRVQVLGVGTTTVVSTTTTGQDGAQTTEELPRTLMTLAVDQAEAEKVIFAAENGELAFALLTEDSEVETGPGVTASTIFE